MGISLVSGHCEKVSNGTFACHCVPGWQGEHCETLADHCVNGTCQNHGVCQSLPSTDYVCHCLSDSYTGRHCELVTHRIENLRRVSQSLGYIAIISLVTVAVFVMIMDLFKYAFGIDPTEQELKQIRRTRAKKKVTRPVGLRFIYVNRPVESPSDVTSV